MKSKLLFTLLPAAMYFAQDADSLQGETQIEEVIITGFQKIEKSKLTSAVSTVKLAEVEQKAVASIDQMLQGKISGVFVMPQSGTPGQIAPMRIRGTASISGPVNPLWVIDGVPLEGNEAPDYNAGEDINLLKNYSIAGINPDDIEDITVLKDASATAIYGARAANGVILVTTKSGKKGRMRVNLSSNTFVNFRPNFNRLNLLNSDQKVDLELAMAAREDLIYRNANGAVMRILRANGDRYNFIDGGFSAISELSQNQINDLRKTNTNWGKLLFQNAINQQHTLSLSGGNDFYKYYTSFGYYDEESTVIGDRFSRYNITAKNDFKISPKLDVSLGIYGTHTTQRSFLSDSGSYTAPSHYSRTANPYLAPFDENGNYIYDRDINYVEKLSGDDIKIPYNYMEERNNTNYKMVTQSIKSILDVNYKILRPLKYRMQLGLQFDNSKTERYANQETYFLRKLRENSVSGNSYIIPLGDYYNEANDRTFSYNLKNILEYSPRFGLNDFNFLLGSEISRVLNTGSNSQVYGYNTKSKTSIPLNIPASQYSNARYRPFSDYENENAFASFFGTASYTYDNRYTIFGSVRYDGTNLFGTDYKKKWNPIWAISGAWNIKRERFLEDNATISLLKLRASYGLQGNIIKNTSPHFTGKYNTATILNITEDIITDEGAPNPKLRWEKTRTIDLGLDFGLWNNRLNFIFDVYKRKGTDILSYKNLPYETGFAFQPINWAEISNKGFELSISSLNIDRDDFSWSTTFNISANRSKIDRVQSSQNPFLPSGEGYPINSVWGFKVAGLDADGVPTFYDKSGAVLSMVDFFKLYDEWADFFPGYMSASEYSAEEMKALYSHLGDRDPKFYGGITNNFRYKNWDLSVAASFNIEKTVMGNPAYHFTSIDRGLNFTTAILDAGNTLPSIIGQETIFDGLVYNYLVGKDSANINSYLDIWSKKMSFVRINSIKLGYSLPADMLKGLGANSLRLSLEGRNLFVFGTNYDGYFDPETYGNIYASPVQKSVVFGLNIGF